MESAGEGGRERTRHLGVSSLRWQDVCRPWCRRFTYHGNARSRACKGSRPQTCPTRPVDVCGCSRVSLRSSAEDF